MAVWIAHRPGGPRADRYFLRGQTLTADGFARAEINTGLLAQQVLGTEALAGAHAETTALTELLAQLQRNATPAIEALGSTILDAKTLAGWLAYQVRDGIAPAESAAIQQKGANASTESLSNARGDAFDPVAFSATQIGNTRDPLENLGANSVLGDEFAPLETLAGRRSDSGPLAEARPNAIGRCGIRHGGACRTPSRCVALDRGAGTRFTRLEYAARKRRLCSSCLRPFPYARISCRAAYRSPNSDHLVDLDPLRRARSD